MSKFQSNHNLIIIAIRCASHPFFFPKVPSPSSFYTTSPPTKNGYRKTSSPSEKSYLAHDRKTEAITSNRTSFLLGIMGLMSSVRGSMMERKLSLRDSDNGWWLVVFGWFSGFLQENNIHMVCHFHGNISLFVHKWCFFSSLSTKTCLNKIWF